MIDVAQFDRLVDLLSQAIELDAEYVEAWNNLGTVLSELNATRDACEAFERAIAIEPEYADAHYNLAETLARQGDETRALRSWREYLRLDPTSAWADRVRERIGDA